MSGKKSHPHDRGAQDLEQQLQAQQTQGEAPYSGLSRRDLLKTGAAGAAAGALASIGLGAQAREHGRWGGRRPNLPDDGYPILLKGGVVLTMDPYIGDFEQADVLIQGSKIVDVRPDIQAAAHVVDCSGMVVMPGFIDTHHHQYETIQRSDLSDGLLRGDWPQESYFSVVQAIWTTGRLGPEDDPLWDLGRSPYEPEDCYIAELVASVSQINHGITTGIDTSQSSHTPEHTDAMIQGLMDSGRRSLYAYGSGRSDSPGYEYPGAIDDTTSGLGRLRKEFFNSDDQLVTLGHTGSGPQEWALARSFEAQIVNHNFDGANLVENPGLLGPDMEMIHAVDFSDDAWRVCADNGVHISIASPIEMQMGHGVPPFQPALDHGILPSLSGDVDTNMTSNMFTLMRSGFTLQRMLINQRVAEGESNVPPLLTCRQVLQMATVAGAAGAGLSDKVGMLSPGKEADVIMLDARTLHTWPMNNAPGTVVTLMDTSNVDTVIIGGKVKKWRGMLVDVDMEKLLRQVEASRDRVLARIKSVPIPVDGLNSAPGYTPSLLGSCCVSAPYNARP